MNTPAVSGSAGNTSAISGLSFVSGKPMRETYPMRTTYSGKDAIYADMVRATYEYAMWTGLTSALSTRGVMA